MNMKQKAVQIQKMEPSPTLNTVLMVEKTLADMDESLVTVAELKRHLPKQVNHNTLMVVLQYLEQSNKIAVSLRGISWIHNPNRRLADAVGKGLEL